MSEGGPSVTPATSPTKGQRKTSTLTAVASSSNSNCDPSVKCSQPAEVGSPRLTTTPGMLTTAEDRAAMEFGDGYRRILEAIGEPGYNSMKSLFYGDGPPAGTIPSITVSFELFEAVQTRFASTKATLERTRTDLHKQHQLYAVLQGQYDQLQETYNILEHRAGELERKNTQLHQDIAKEGVTAEQLRQQIARMVVEIENMEKKMMKRDEELQVSQQRVAEGLLLLSQKETIIANLRRQLGRSGRGHGQSGAMESLGADGEEYTADALRRIANDVEGRSIEAQLRLCLVELEAKLRSVGEERRYIMLRHTLYRKHVQDVTQAYEALCMAEEDTVHSYLCREQTPPEMSPQAPVKDSSEYTSFTSPTKTKKTGGKRNEQDLVGKRVVLREYAQSSGHIGAENQELRMSTLATHSLSDASVLSLDHSPQDTVRGRWQQSFISSPHGPLSSPILENHASTRHPTQQVCNSISSVGSGVVSFISISGDGSKSDLRQSAASLSVSSPSRRRGESQKKGEGHSSRSHGDTKESTKGRGKRAGGAGAARDLGGSVQSSVHSHKSSREGVSKNTTKPDSPLGSHPLGSSPHRAHAKHDQAQEHQRIDDNSDSTSRIKSDKYDKGIQTEMYTQRDSRYDSTRLASSISGGQSQVSPKQFVVSVTAPTSVAQSARVAGVDLHSRSTDADGGMYSSVRGVGYSHSGGIFDPVLPSFVQVGQDGDESKRLGSFFSISAADKVSPRRAPPPNTLVGAGEMESKERQEINQRLHVLTGNYATLHGLLLDLDKLLRTAKGVFERENSLKLTSFHLDGKSNGDVATQVEYVNDTVTVDIRLVEHLLRLLQESSSASGRVKSLEGGIPQTGTSPEKKGGITSGESRAYELPPKDIQYYGSIDTHMPDAQIHSLGGVPPGSQISAANVSGKLGPMVSDSGSKALKADGGVSITTGGSTQDSGAHIMKKSTTGTSGDLSRGPRRGVVGGDVSDEKKRKQHLESEGVKGGHGIAGVARSDTTVITTTVPVPDGEKHRGDKKDFSHPSGTSRSEGTKKYSPQAPKQQRGFTRHRVDGTPSVENAGDGRWKETRETHANVRGGRFDHPQPLTPTSTPTTAAPVTTGGTVATTPSTITTTTTTTTTTTGLPILPASGGHDVVHVDRTPQLGTGAVGSFLPTLPGITQEKEKGPGRWTRRATQRTPWNPAVIHLDLGQLDVEHGGTLPVTRPFYSHHQAAQGTSAPWTSFFNRAVGNAGVPTRMGNNQIESAATLPETGGNDVGAGQTSPSGLTASPSYTRQYIEPAGSQLPYNLSRFITPSQGMGYNAWEGQSKNLVLGGAAVWRPTTPSPTFTDRTQYPLGGLTPPVDTAELTLSYPNVSYTEQISDMESMLASSVLAISGRKLGETQSTMRGTKAFPTASGQQTDKQGNVPLSLPVPRQYVITEVMRYSPVLYGGGRRKRSSSSSLKPLPTARNFWHNMFLLRNFYARQRHRVRLGSNYYTIHGRPRLFPLFQFHQNALVPATDLWIGRPRESVATRNRSRREMYAKRVPRRFSFERRRSLMRFQYGGTSGRQQQQQQQQQQYQTVPLLIRHWGGEHPHRFMK